MLKAKILTKIDTKRVESKGLLNIVASEIFSPFHAIVKETTSHQEKENSTMGGKWAHTLSK